METAPSHKNLYFDVLFSLVPGIWQNLIAVFGLNFELHKNTAYNMHTTDWTVFLNYLDTKSNERFVVVQI